MIDWNRGAFVTPEEFEKMMHDEFIKKVSSLMKVSEEEVRTSYERMVDELNNHYWRSRYCPLAHFDFVDYDLYGIDYDKSREFNIEFLWGYVSCEQSTEKMFDIITYDK